MAENDQDKTRFILFPGGLNFGSTPTSPTVKLSVSGPVSPGVAPAVNPGSGLDSSDMLRIRAHELLQAGQWQLAVECCQRLLILEPTDPGAHSQLGLAQKGLGNITTSISCFRRALELKPDLVEAHYKLGTIYQSQGKLDEAIRCFESAVKFQPDHGDAHYNMGAAFQATGQLDEAERHYQAAITCNQRDGDAHNNLGMVYTAQDKHEAAAESFARAIELQPDDINALNNLGAALLKLDRPQESLQWCRRALTLQPDCVAAHINMGTVCLKLNDLDQAIVHYRQAVSLEPDNADIDAHLGLGHALTSKQELELARRSYRKALDIQPDCERAHAGLGDIAVAELNYETAIEHYRKALAAKPDSSDYKFRLFCAQRHLCLWNDDGAFDDVLPQARDLDINPWLLLALTDSASAQLRCAERHARHFQSVRQDYPTAEAIREQGKIRIAYVSADFRNHPVALLLAGVLEKHDKQRFEVIALSLKAPDGSRLGQRVRNAVDRHVDVSAMTDHEIVKLMRELQVDIAVDLMGCTKGGRMAVFCSRPAPVQVNFLGHAGTLGSNSYDYIVADKRVIPEDNQQYYSERIAYLPDTFLPTDDQIVAANPAPTRVQHGLPDAAFVFCSFNNDFKFNPSIFDIWMRLLKKVENSVLWLPRGRSSAHVNLRREAAARGVSPERLVFAPFTDTHAEHVARLKLADLFLDTLPYNAHTTAVDALAAGVPLLTCMGEAFAARVAGSLLHATGMQELITTSLSEYEEKALLLARQPELLARLRKKLEANLNSGPLFDSRRYAQHLEAAYATMHQRRLRGEAPAGFEVAPISA
ncbi:MAG: tetratricopeptide repeat protein [Xanthomonadales bacterium]|nr:tetratricopeptide repeat protein [Xanthomonadales bacterium]